MGRERYNTDYTNKRKNQENSKNQHEKSPDTSPYAAHSFYLNVFRMPGDILQHIIHGLT